MAMEDYMRTFGDRIRHAIAFEIVGLAIFVPGSALILGHPIGSMGVIGVVSATVATIWNFVFNLLFDHGMRRFVGTVHKTTRIRLVHTGLFELGLILVLIPFIAWYLQISLVDALVLDVGIVIFYLVFGFLFNLAYDRVFPLSRLPSECSTMPAGQDA
jgi:uncharacterized membrane protein